MSFPAFKRKWPGLLVGMLALALAAGRAEGQSKEYQIKAAFLYNFAQFVEWPSGAFADPQSPLVIGVLGNDPFGSFLTDLVRGAKVDDHPLVIQHYDRVEDVQSCQILFISRSESQHLNEVLAGLKGRNILTVGDENDFAGRGGVVRFLTENNKIKFRINLDAAREANLTISSKMLKCAEVMPRGGE